MIHNCLVRSVKTEMERHMEERTFVFNVYTSSSETPTFQPSKRKIYESILPLNTTAVEIRDSLLDFYDSIGDPLWKEPNTSHRQEALFLARWPGGIKRIRSAIRNDDDWETFLKDDTESLISPRYSDLSSVSVEVDVILWTKKQPKRVYHEDREGRSKRIRTTTVQIVIRPPVYLHEGKSKRSARELRSGKDVHGSKAIVATLELSELELLTTLSLGDYRVRCFEHLHSGNDAARRALAQIDQMNGGVYKACGPGTKMEHIIDTRMMRQIVRSMPHASGIKTLTIAFGSGPMASDCLMTATIDGDDHFSQSDISTPLPSDVADSNKKASADSKISMSIDEKIVQAVYSHPLSPYYHGLHSRHATFLANYLNQHPSKTIKYGTMLDVEDFVQLFEELEFPDWEHRTAQKACGNGELPMKNKFPPNEGTNKPPTFVFKPPISSLADTLAALVQMRSRQMEMGCDTWISALRYVAKEAQNLGLIPSSEIRQMVKVLLHDRNAKMLANLVQATSEPPHTMTPSPPTFIDEYKSLMDLGFFYSPTNEN
ncbi:hypothetical protein AeMF1_016212 [Aphanomyces euteiches]|nr:hypothetical protein AeMF1_016212 [Aphanomyces euteiches]